MVRLSFLELVKLSLIDASVTDGRVIRPEPALRVELDFARMEGRFFGTVGAYFWLIARFHIVK